MAFPTIKMIPSTTYQLPYYNSANPTRFLGLYTITRNLERDQKMKKRNKIKRRDSWENPETGAY